MLLALLMKKETFEEKADAVPDTAASVTGKKKSKRDRDNVRLVISLISGILSPCYIRYIDTTLSPEYSRNDLYPKCMSNNVDDELNTNNNS
jgi:hypothetical protein